jgi:hypothetical protein
MSAANQESYEEKKARLQKTLDEKTETHEALKQQRRDAETHKPSPEQKDDHQKWINKTHEEEQRAQGEKVRAAAELQKLEMEERERRLHEDYVRSREEQKQKQQQEQREQQHKRSPQKKV